jgi:hypothetical protein
MKNAFLFILGTIGFYGSLWLLLLCLFSAPLVSMVPYGCCLCSPRFILPGQFRSLNNERLFRPFPHACQ